MTTLAALIAKYGLYLYFGQAAAGAVVGFAYPFLVLFGVL